MPLAAWVLMAAASQAGESTPAEVEVLVERLGSDDIQERAESSATLKRLGAVALDAIMRASDHADPEIAGRARELFAALLPRLSPEELGRIPLEKMGLADIDLHTLTVRVQQLVGKEILWTEDLNLRNRRVHLVSDVILGHQPELLFKVYQSILGSTDLVLVPLIAGAETAYRIRPSTGRTKALAFIIRVAGVAPEDRFTTRVISLRGLDAGVAQSALMNMASYPECILRSGPGNLLLATDRAGNIRRFEALLEFMERTAE